MEQTEVSARVPTKIVASVAPADIDPRQIGREFRGLLDAGARLRPAGEARKDPESLLRGYSPKYRIDLFGTRFYLTNVRQNPAIRFFVAYVVQSRRDGTYVFPRIFYKDLSLVWRSASHLVNTHDEFWIGKGDLTVCVEDGEEIVCSAEETTDLPLEMQTALESLNRQTRFVRTDEQVLWRVLRCANYSRLAPYRDFTEPRRKAQADRRNLVYGGRKIATFTRANDPESLRFVPGYEPEFTNGILEASVSKSAMYGGTLRRFRILSRNRRVQFLFFAAPRHAWVIPPQATTTELSSYGVRTIDVAADEHLFVPGYEYHFVDEAQDPAVLFSQIPAGFAGAPSSHDPSRADASAWLDRLPVIKEFRRQVLRKRHVTPIAVEAFDEGC